MSYNPSTDGNLDLFDLKKFKELLRGPIGLEGRSPMHVSMKEPIEDIEVGDLWYKPLKTPKVFILTASGWEEILKQGPIGLEGEAGRNPIIHRGSKPPDNPFPGDLWIRD